MAKMKLTPRAFAALLPLTLTLSACGGGGEAVEDARKAELEKKPGSAFIADDVASGKAALDRVIEPLFNGSIGGETRALIVMHNGEIVAERYAPGFDKDTPLIGWSMSKSVTAVLIGLLITDGRLQLDDPAPVPHWQSPGDPRGAITIRHLLHMSAGLDHTEALGPESKKEVYDGDATRMLFLDGAADMAGYAEKRMLEAKPGTKYEYSTATTVILADIITRALTDSDDPKVRAAAVTEFAKGRLFDPVGMDSMAMEFDAAGTMVGGSYIHATARDWAKFGELLRNNGSVRGAQIVPGSWIRWMKEPAPTNAAYGGQIWRNVARTDGQDEVILFPGLAPSNTIAAQGHYGQYVITSPDQRLTVVRLGFTEGNRDDLTQQLGRIFALFPAS